MNGCAPIRSASFPSDADVTAPLPSEAVTSGALAASPSAAYAGAPDAHSEFKELLLGAAWIALYLGALLSVPLSAIGFALLLSAVTS